MSDIFVASSVNILFPIVEKRSARALTSSANPIVFPPSCLRGIFISVVDSPLFKVVVAHELGRLNKKKKSKIIAGGPLVKRNNLFFINTKGGHTYVN